MGLSNRGALIYDLGSPLAVGGAVGAKRGRGTGEREVSLGILKSEASPGFCYLGLASSI